MTPLAAAAIIATMLNAGVAVHGRNGPWAVDNGYEYPLVLGAVAATLGFTGAGAASLDAWLGVSAGGTEAGILAIGMGLVAGAAVLVSRTAALSEAGPNWTATSTRKTSTERPADRAAA